MAIEQFANNASTTLNGAIDDSVTSLVLTSATGFPASGQFRIIIDSEIILVGAISGTTCSSLTRGAEGTAAAAHSDGATITHVLTAEAMELCRPVFIRKTADESVASSTTLQADDHLFFDIGANEAWAITYNFLLDAPITADFQFSIVAPTGATGWFGGMRITDQATSGSNIGMNTSVATTIDGTGARFVGGGGAGVLIHSMLHAFIANSSTAGQVQLQWAQVTTNATASIVKADSYLIAFRVA